MPTRPSLTLCALSVALAACQAQAAEPPKNAAPPPQKVLVTPVVRKDVPQQLEAVATVDGYVNADIRARVRGYLSSQDYKEGGLVKANQRLFSIERSEYESAVASAGAALTRARAVAERNRSQLARVRGLFESGAISQQEIDNAVAANADADAQVQGARAQLQQAQLNLSYTQLRSPIDGVAGLAAVRVGNLVGQDGPTLLTTVSQIDPMRVSFPVTERDYIAFQERFRQLARRDLAWAKRQFDKLEHGEAAEANDPGVELVLADGSVFPHRGIVVTAGRQFDPSTGTIQLQALVPNPEGVLRPGQYGRIRLQRPRPPEGALAVPDKALISVQGTYSLAVVGADDKVALRRVEVGPSVNGVRVIVKGVNEGERVVVEGVQKVSDGAQVQPELAPEATASTNSQGADRAHN